jgi:hypothetical protein
MRGSTTLWIDRSSDLQIHRVVEWHDPFERKEHKTMRSWLETSDGEMFSAAEAEEIGVHVISAEEAFASLPKDVDDAAVFLRLNDPEEGGTAVLVR